MIENLATTQYLNDGHESPEVYTTAPEVGGDMKVLVLHLYVQIQCTFLVLTKNYVQVEGLDARMYMVCCCIYLTRIKFNSRNSFVRPAAEKIVPND